MYRQHSGEPATLDVVYVPVEVFLDYEHRVFPHEYAAVSKQ